MAEMCFVFKNVAGLRIHNQGNKKVVIFHFPTKAKNTA
jgi:hypothetical protein